MQPVSADEAAYFLKLFRGARYAALEDAENFREICFVLEEFGCHLNGNNTKSLRKYGSLLRSFANQKRRQEFSVMFDMVVDARNEASHRGVFARNLAGKSVRLSIILEESLLNMTVQVKHLMSESVIFAEDFYTLAKVREIMLENSFSYIPVMLSGKYYFISDSLVAKKWQDFIGDDKAKYNTRISQLLSLKELLEAEEILSHAPKSEAYLKVGHLPLLVFNGKHENRKVVGILSPFDLL
ncbi:CBS domain-containing protein [Deinococcus sp. VB343]|uniref:CBS domain-containing protein n=1 Tax=Deinococcus sp. VB343 TaxID=3385567 RepID=UPI0039C909F3